MAFDGAGNYSLPPGSIVSDGTTIDASDHNVPVTDIAAALSQVLLRSGVAPMTGNLNMGGFSVTNVGGTNPVLTGDNIWTGANTWSGTSIFTGTTHVGDDAADTVVIKGSTVSPFSSACFSGTNAESWRNNLGLGTAATQNIGTNGATVPMLNGANTWNAAQTITAVQSGGGVLGLQATNAANAAPVMSFAEPTGPRITGSVTYAGAPGAFGVNYNISSDGRLKQNRRAITDSGAIIDALNPIYFRRGGSGADDSGFIAQEIAAVPQLAHNVIRGDDDPDRRPGQPGFVDWQMAIGKMEAILVAEIKALRARVAALEAALP